MDIIIDTVWALLLQPKQPIGDVTFVTKRTSAARRCDSTHTLCTYMSLSVFRSIRGVTIKIIKCMIACHTDTTNLYTQHTRMCVNPKGPCSMLVKTNQRGHTFCQISYADNRASCCNKSCCRSLPVGNEIFVCPRDCRQEEQESKHPKSVALIIHLLLSHG